METNYLLNIIFDGNPLQGLDEEVPGLSLDNTFNTGIADIPDPVQKICERAQFDLLAKNVNVSESWDSQLTPAAPLAKRGTPKTFPVGSEGHKLQIVSVEELTVDSGIGPEKWVYGYDVAGVLVDARLVRDEAA